MPCSTELSQKVCLSGTARILFKYWISLTKGLACYPVNGRLLTSAPSEHEKTSTAMIIVVVTSVSIKISLQQQLMFFYAKIQEQSRKKMQESKRKQTALIEKIQKTYVTSILYINKVILLNDYPYIGIIIKVIATRKAHPQQQIHYSQRGRFSNESVDMASCEQILENFMGET